MLPNLELMRLEALEQTELDEQKQVLLARRYHDGDQNVYLNERALEYLGLHAENKFRLNVCRTVVVAVLDELNLTGFDTGEEGDSRPLSDWAAQVMTANRMDVLQKDVHEVALRDREAFVIVDWDVAKGIPHFTWLPRYTSLATGDDFADEMGCYAVYPDDDYTQQPDAVVKRWIELIPLGSSWTQRQRQTVYYPDRIERYYYGAGWQPYIDNPDDVWPTPWVDSAGQPLGIPAIHFKNEGLRPEAWDAIPMQDAINKLLVDILGAADLTGFRILFASGFIPTTDGGLLKPDESNAAEIAPGQIIGTTKENAKLTAIDGASPVPLMDVLTQIIQHTAHITATPPGRFSSAAQVQSGDSQKEQGKPFIAKVDDRQVRFGNAWEDVMNMARKLEATFGTVTVDLSLPFSATWNHSYSLDDLTKKKALGVPQEQIWIEMGYTQKQIETMKKMDEYRMKIEAQQVSLNASRSMMNGG